MGGTGRRQQDERERDSRACGGYTGLKMEGGPTEKREKIKEGGRMEEEEERTYEGMEVQSENSKRSEIHPNADLFSGVMMVMSLTCKRLRFIQEQHGYQVKKSRTDTGVSVMSPSHAPSREAALGNKGNGFNQEVVDRHTDRLRVNRVYCHIWSC
ncbi:hypothetical protein NQZ68_000562 [Dissostichus eleginoides]|nr:hypothetical protein NQZ68_000562 [Dissostichus eleginoides]